MAISRWLNILTVVKINETFSKWCERGCFAWVAPGQMDELENLHKAWFSFGST